MARRSLIVITGFLLLALSTACGEADPTMEPVAAAPTSEAATIITATPADDVSATMAQRALDYTIEQGAAISSQPQVVLSRSATLEQLTNLGFGRWYFEAGCVVPMHLVILNGDFDARQVIPLASLPAEQMVPARFLVYIYDMNLNEMVSAFGDPNGGFVKKALGDPSLPDVDPSTLPNTQRGSADNPLPCKRIDAPGGVVSWGSTAPGGPK